MLSKHCMHCKMADKVRYAGECQFQWEEEPGVDQKEGETHAGLHSEPKFWLVLDNNSGMAYFGWVVSWRTGWSVRCAPVVLCRVD